MNVFNQYHCQNRVLNARKLCWKPTHLTKLSMLELCALECFCTFNRKIKIKHVIYFLGSKFASYNLNFLCDNLPQSNDFSMRKIDVKFAEKHKSMNETERRDRGSSLFGPL